jgi:hypothetical protein
MRPPVFVRNAADADQVKRAARREKTLEQLDISWTRAVLSTYEGRAFCRRWLERLGMYRSIFESSAKIYYNAGRQDAAHEYAAQLIEADEDLYAQMELEARQRAKRLANELDAAHTPRAIPGEDTL